MEEIIAPVDRNLIEQELTLERKLGDTNKGGNELYVIDGRNAPNTLREIGRLREIAFREAGASSGLAVDLDEYDMLETPYQQLIVWDPDAKAIIGGYRYILGKDITLKADGQPRITSSHLYHYSDAFIKNYLPHVMELGRSFVAPEYQSSKAGAKSLFTMDNLWDGIVSVTMEHPSTLYFIGKMTIYPLYNHVARDLILRFLSKHFHDPDELVRPYHPIGFETDPILTNLILCESDLRKDYRRLKEAVRNLGTNIPPLVNSYINLSSTMKCFASTFNDELGDAIETGIMICFNEMYEDKRERHIEAFLRKRLEDIREKHPRFYASAAEKLREHMEKRRLKFFQKFQRELRPQEQSPEVEFI